MPKKFFSCGFCANSSVFLSVCRFWLMCRNVAINYRRGSNRTAKHAKGNQTQRCAPRVAYKDNALCFVRFEFSSTKTRNLCNKKFTCQNLIFNSSKTRKFSPNTFEKAKK